MVPSIHGNFLQFSHIVWILQIDHGQDWQSLWLGVDFVQKFSDYSVRLASTGQREEQAVIIVQMLYLTTVSVENCSIFSSNLISIKKN
jgi:hypothetical protein